MLGATQAVLLGAARCPLVDYAATVTGIPGLVAYWRCSDAATIVDATAGGRHGSYDGPVALVSGLPAESDQATRLGGTTRGTVPTDAGLDLAAFTLSIWVVVHEDPEDIRAVLAREQSGLTPGDFGLYYNDGEFYAQFQSASEQLRAFGPIGVGTPHHIAVTAGGAGFALWIDGRLHEENASFTGGWSSNGNDLVFGSAQQLADELDITIDEVALYSRVLTDLEIVSLSQRTGAPVAVGDSAIVTEGNTLVLDVVANDAYVGRKSGLTVEVWDGDSWESAAVTGFGTATVNGNNDIEFAAGAVTQDEADSVQYRIADANGSSASCTVSLVVQDTSSAGGGILVYQWQADASWIDGVALADRDLDDVLGAGETGQPSPNRWVEGASVGGGLVRTIGRRSNWASNDDICWNRAPTGHPALEMHAQAGDHNVTDFWLELYPPDDGAGPRHLRVVMEIKTCKASDPTTYKADGKGPATGTYPDFTDSHESGTKCGIKYFCCMGQGARPRGAAVCNWWNDSTRPIDGVGYMIQSRKSGKNLDIYSGSFDRPNSGGVLGDPGSALLTDPGVDGYWHRVELEVKLTTPATVPENARRAEPEIEPSHTGDGEMRLYLTKDIDGELGIPGQRELMDVKTGIITNPKYDDVGSDDNMHVLLNLTGPWLDYYYGGSDVCQNDAWAWLRKMQVYRHD